MRTLAFSLLVSAAFAAGSNYAAAAPASGIAVSDAAQQSGTLTLVRDGCGRGRHFSKWRGICVWNRPHAYRYGPPVYPAPIYRAPVYGPPVYGYGYYGPPVVYGPPVYGYYRRW